jgi:hypothetical protein
MHHTLHVCVMLVRVSDACLYVRALACERKYLRALVRVRVCVFKRVHVRVCMCVCVCVLISVYMSALYLCTGTFKHSVGQKPFILN